MSMLIDVLLEAANANHQRTALRFVGPNGEIKDLTFGALVREARCISGFLQKNTVVGNSVLLVFPTGLEFLPAFLSCLDAGVLAVPLPLPSEWRTGMD